MTTGDLARLRADVGAFAKHLVGEELWPHQMAVATSAARIRCLLAGRQSGKSRTLSIVALHTAFAAPDRHVLLVSAGENASRRLLEECSWLCSMSPLLASSVTDETKAEIRLSNGSVIMSVPASMRAIRGWAADLLVVDEGCFVPAEVWQAARWTIVARPGSRVILTSTPFGRKDGWFATEYRAGEAGVGDRESFHWPSTMSPLVDATLLEMWRETSTSREFKAEVEAIWVDDEGAVFSSDLIEAAVDDYELVPPHEAAGMAAVVGGVDWGKAHDASAVVLLAVRSAALEVGIPPEGRQGIQDTYSSGSSSNPGQRLPDVWVAPDRSRAVIGVADLVTEPANDGPTVWWIPWLVERFHTPYGTYIEEVVGITRGYSVRRLVSETNGVGAFPTEELGRRLAQAHVPTRVEGVHTTNVLKEDAFGTLRMLMEQGRLRLPRHPELLRQLAACSYETTESGATRIAVAERLGHDDLLMSLALAASALRDEMRRRPPMTAAQHEAVASANRGLCRPNGSYWRG